LLGDPDLLFLDEPTTGLDPAARRVSWELIRRLSDAGTTIILTSHYLDEVEQLADRVGVMVRGRLVTEGTPASLVAAAGLTVVRFPLPDDVDRAELSFIDSGVEVLDGHVIVPTPTPAAMLHDLTGWALERGHDLAGLTVTRPTLEDMFLAVTSREAGADDA
jgi:ABC-2 type transport system ATP-binding protein